MRHLKNHVINEHGISLIPTMIVLAIATMIGIAASTTSNFEIKIAANDRIYKRNFFRADGANQQGAQLIENTAPAELKTRSPAWMTFYNQATDYLDKATWCTPAMVTAGECATANADDGGITDTQFMVVDNGGAVGTEISMGSPYMHSMSVYGRYDSDAPKGRVIIETEYRKKY